MYLLGFITMTAGSHETGPNILALIGVSILFYARGARLIVIQASSDKLSVIRVLRLMGTWLFALAGVTFIVANAAYIAGKMHTKGSMAPILHFMTLGPCLLSV